MAYNLNFIHLKLCLAEPIYNIKWVTNFQTLQTGGQTFETGYNCIDQFSAGTVFRY